MQLMKVQNEKQRDDAFLVRRVVFIHEQQVPEELEMDEFDQDAAHFVGYVEEDPVAAGRVRLVEDYGKLERICVKKDYRGHHFGKDIILHIEDYLKGQGYLKAKLNAQTHAEGFYQSLGYETISEEFMDAGIPHVTMIKTLT
ncbi:GNAT family N-acetyltransferase [Halobacillus salinus]|uniref:GNAT family N-acetyltransferase n=1 Tax=Halobacillus salinus TaxID=192814 RepID=A0A4Z0H452_9BACI|nr:GNAT family N-acetyltransferase [Halobacillus salinus]TGB05193.1 GNAT family N-acetyltransferase [Halobacillus salinus]